MNARKLYEDARRKYKSAISWADLSVWDKGCWERHAQRLGESIEDATKLLREHGYTVTEPEN